MIKQDAGICPARIFGNDIHSSVNEERRIAKKLNKYPEIVQILIEAFKFDTFDSIWTFFLRKCKILS